MTTRATRPYHEFGAWLRSRRLDRRWTQAELARRLAYDVSYIRKIEWGERRASDPLRVRVGQVLGVPVANLPGAAGTPPAAGQPPTELASGGWSPYDSFTRWGGGAFVAGQRPEEAATTYLTAGEAARLLEVSPKTVSRWADKGLIPCVVTLGRHRRFDRREVERIQREMYGPQPDESPDGMPAPGG